MQIQNTTKVMPMTDFSMRSNIEKRDKMDVNFQQMMDTQNTQETEQDGTEVKERIYTLIEDIDELKKKLEENLNLKNLEEYKNYVKQFVEHYSENEIELKEELVQNNRTYSNKKYTVIDTINEKVNSMTEDLLLTNRGHIELLSKMGEINGLIVDLLI